MTSAKKYVTVSMLTSGTNLAGHKFQAPNLPMIFFLLYLFVLSIMHLGMFYEHFDVFLS